MCNKLFVYLLVFVSVFGGCATAKTVRYTAVEYAEEVKYAPIDPGDIKVFSIPPNRGYIEIGEIRVQAPVYDAVETIEELRARVAKMGGEAVILRIPESKGIVIRFKD